MAEMQQDELSIKDFFLKIKEWFFYILSKWVWLVLAGALGGAIGIAYAYLKKPEYTATLSFVLEDEKSGGGGLSGALGLASQFGIDLGGAVGSAFSGVNLMELMKSRSLVEKTLLAPVAYNGKKTSLADVFIDFNEWRKDWTEKPKLANINFLPGGDRKTYTLQQDSILGLIYKDISKDYLSVTPRDKKASIIDVRIRAENELFAKWFVETLASEVSDFYIETKTKKTMRSVRILQKQTDSVREELNNAISGVASATDNTFNLNPALNIKRTPTQRRQVDVQANSAILTELVKNLELAKVTLRRETPLIQIVDNPILPLEKKRTGKMTSMLIGGFLTGFIVLLFFILRRSMKQILA